MRFQVAFVDSRYDESQLAALPTEEQERLLNFCYVNPCSRLYVYCGDGARYINHSEQPNTDDLGFDECVFEGEGITIAARDIRPGKKFSLTIDHSTKMFEMA